MQRKIDIYAMQNLDKLEELKSNLEAIRKDFQALQLATPLEEIIETRRIKTQKEIENYKYVYGPQIQKNKELQQKAKIEKENLLERLKEIELGYQVFKDFVKEENWQELYKIKFDLLTFQLDIEDDNIFDNISNKERYIEIIEKKLEMLFKAQSKYPRLYGRFINQIKKLFIEVDTDCSIAENVLNVPCYLKFIVDIENPNFLKQIIEVEDEYGDRLGEKNNEKLTLTPYPIMTLEEYGQLIQFLIANQAPWKIENVESKFEYIIKDKKAWIELIKNNSIDEDEKFRVELGEWNASQKGYEVQVRNLKKQFFNDRSYNRMIYTIKIQWHNS